MPKIVIHAPEAAFDDRARQAIVGELTDFALGCEAIPTSPFVRSTVWTSFNDYPASHVFMGADRARTNVVSVEIFTIEGGLNDEAKKKLIRGTTNIVGRQLGKQDRIPVYIVVYEIPEVNWGIFGQIADLAALRASPPDAPAI